MDGDGWNCLYKYLTPWLFQSEINARSNYGNNLYVDLHFYQIAAMGWFWWYGYFSTLIHNHYWCLYPHIHMLQRTTTLVDPALYLFSRLGCTNIHSIFHTLHLTVILPTLNPPLHLWGPVPMVTWWMADNVPEIRLNTLDVRPFRLLIQVLAPNQMYLTIHIW